MGSAIMLRYGISLKKIIMIINIYNDNLSLIFSYGHRLTYLFLIVRPTDIWIGGNVLWSRFIFSVHTKNIIIIIIIIIVIIIIISSSSSSSILFNVILLHIIF